MQRTTAISIASVVLLTAALGISFCYPQTLFHALQQDSGKPLIPFIGLVFATGLALLCILRFRADLRRVQKQLEHHKAMGRVSRLDRGAPEVNGVIDSMNSLLVFAQQSMEQAALQVKELDIQLKVATSERQHAQAIIYSISDAVLVTDPFDELVLANDAAARVFDFELGVSRRPIDQVLREKEMVDLIREVRQRSSRNARRVVEHQVETPVGPRTYKVTLSCVTDRRGEPAGVVTVLHDMTRERELAQMKNDFVSSVSHELRTPLASIKAYTEMLIDGEAADEKTAGEFYQVIHSEATRLERLIDNILNISRIESGLVRITKRPQSLMVLTKEAIEVITPQAGQRGITIEEQLTPACYQTLIDKDMVYQAVLNLLSNSVKYTPEGGKITVQSIVDDTNHKVITRISDTGVGIPPKDLPFVFDKFYRSEANAYMAKGTGLGLSLVRHIIETVHNGRIFVESQVGKGSTFGFELDLID